MVKHWTRSRVALIFPKNPRTPIEAKLNFWGGRNCDKLELKEVVDIGYEREKSIELVIGFIKLTSSSPISSCRVCDQLVADSPPYAYHDYFGLMIGLMIGLIIGLMIGLAVKQIPSLLDLWIRSSKRLVSWFSIEKTKIRYGTWTDRTHSERIHIGRNGRESLPKNNSKSKMVYWLGKFSQSFLHLLHHDEMIVRKIKMNWDYILFWVDFR